MKDMLVKIPAEMAHPATMTGDDFKMSGGMMGKVGMAEGQDKLIMDSVNQCGPRHTEDEGPGKSGAGTPVPTMRSRILGKNFPVAMNMGEGSEKPMSMMSKFDEVNCKDGQSVPNVMMDRS